MTTKTNIFMKRVMPFAMVLLMVLSVVLVPITADAAAKPSGVKKIILQKGQSWDLIVYELKDNAKVTYKSSKKSVATVSKKGKIKAKKKGSATITTTIKQGGKTYKLTTKVTVKTKTTVHDDIYSLNCDFCETYNTCANLANANGWNADATAVEWLDAFRETVLLVQEISKDKKAYSEEDMKTVYDLIVGFSEEALKNLEVFAEPY